MHLSGTGLSEIKMGDSRLCHLKNFEKNFSNAKQTTNQQSNKQKEITNMTTDNFVGTPQVFKKKPTQHEVIQFTGKNSKVVADWVRERGYKAKAGGAYVDVTDDRDFTQRLTRGMLIAALAENHIHVYTEEDFRAAFTISKTHELL